MTDKIKKPSLKYFDEPEELAVLEYLYGDPANRDKVFREKLNAPLNKMVESLIKRYRLMREDVSIDDLKNDTLSFLLTKFSKFDEKKDTKAYSYFGTICINHLRTELTKYSKRKNKSVSYEDISTDLEGNVKYMYEMNIEEKVETIDFIPMISQGIRNEINNNPKLKVNEKKVGEAIIEILENWETMITNKDKSNILARNKILFAIRESTFLNAKEVRNALKKYKVLYDVLKKSTYLDD